MALEILKGILGSIVISFSCYVSIISWWSPKSLLFIEILSQVFCEEEWPYLHAWELKFLFTHLSLFAYTLIYVFACWFIGLIISCSTTINPYLMAIFIRQKPHFHPYIFTRFPLWSLSFIFTTFSPYLEKRLSF